MILKNLAIIGNVRIIYQICRVGVKIIAHSSTNDLDISLSQNRESKFQKTPFFRSCPVYWASFLFTFTLSSKIKQNPYFPTTSSAFKTTIGEQNCNEYMKIEGFNFIIIYSSKHD